MDRVRLNLLLFMCQSYSFLYVEGDGCHDGGNHEWNRCHDRKLEGDAFLHGITLTRPCHVKYNNKKNLSDSPQSKKSYSHDNKSFSSKGQGKALMKEHDHVPNGIYRH
jgi:hypothetical protein